MTPRTTTPNDKPLQFHPLLLTSFVPLPSDVSIPLSPEQLNGIFPNQTVWTEMLEMVQSNPDLVLHNDADLEETA